MQLFKKPTPSTFKASPVGKPKTLLEKNARAVTTERMIVRGNFIIAVFSDGVLIEAARARFLILEADML